MITEEERIVRLREVISLYDGGYLTSAQVANRIKEIALIPKEDSAH